MMEKGERIFSGFNLANFLCLKSLEVSGHFHPSAILSNLECVAVQRLCSKLKSGFLPA